MKRRLILILILLVLVAAALWVIFFFIERRRNGNELILFGNVDVRQVDIGFRVAGQVDMLCFEEGDFVPKGTLLATLDKTPYDSQLRQAEANVQAIKASFENAEILLTRRQELIGEGGVSQEDLDDALRERNVQYANLLSARAAQAIASDNLLYTEAYSPSDGIILTRIREPGTVVRDSDPVYTISISSPVWIRAFVAEPQLGLVYYGMPAEIHTDTRGGTIYKGQVGFISPVAEFTPKTVETTQLRTDLVYRLRIYAENPDLGLKQGMPVTVKLKLHDRNEQKAGLDQENPPTKDVEFEAEQG